MLITEPSFRQGSSWAGKNIIMRTIPTSDRFDNPSVEKRYQPIPHLLGTEVWKPGKSPILCYESQVGEFWRDETETRLALRNYLAGGGGRLWH